MALEPQVVFGTAFVVEPSALPARRRSAEERPSLLSAVRHERSVGSVPPPRVSAAAIAAAAGSGTTRRGRSAAIDGNCRFIGTNRIGFFFRPAV